MRLLLDTHALLWWLADDEALEDDAWEQIGRADNDVFVSAASAWEMSIKKALGKLEAPADLADQVAEQRFSPLPITIEHGLAAGALPRHHDDPFDRMLVAQAKVEALTIVTRDPRFTQYGVAVVPA